VIGTTLGHYRIVVKIAEGGMGEVYRAHDERLDRDVAVKVFHREVVRDADRLARFEREAKAVAKLAHPNILAIHDFGTDQGTTYAVTGGEQECPPWAEGLRQPWAAQAVPLSARSSSSLERTRLTWSLTRTLRQTAAMRPSGSIRNVERTMPMYSRPAIFFRLHTP